MKNLLEGSSRHEVNTLPEIESRIDDFTHQVEHFDNGILMVTDRGSLEWAPSLTLRRCYHLTRARLVVPVMSFYMESHDHRLRGVCKNIPGIQISWRV